MEREIEVALRLHEVNNCEMFFPYRFKCLRNFNPSRGSYSKQMAFSYLAAALSFL